MMSSSRPDAGTGDIGHGSYGVVIISDSMSATDVVALEKVRQPVFVSTHILEHDPHATQ